MIYVDELKKCQPRDESGGRWRFKNYCHLWAESLTELHKFAQEIGLKLDYFQNLPGFPHYDLTKTMRLRAVRAGAVEISTRELVERTNAIFPCGGKTIPITGVKTGPE